MEERVGRANAADDYERFGVRPVIHLDPDEKDVITWRVSCDVVSKSNPLKRAKLSTEAIKTIGDKLPFLLFGDLTIECLRRNHECAALEEISKGAVTVQDELISGFGPDAFIESTERAQSSTLSVPVDHPFAAYKFVIEPVAREDLDPTTMGEVVTRPHYLDPSQPCITTRGTKGKSYTVILTTSSLKRLNTKSATEYAQMTEDDANRLAKRLGAVLRDTILNTEEGLSSERLKEIMEAEQLDEVMWNERIAGNLISTDEMKDALSQGGYSLYSLDIFKSKNGTKLKCLIKLRPALLYDFKAKWRGIDDMKLTRDGPETVLTVPSTVGCFRIAATQYSTKERLSILENPLGKVSLIIYARRMMGSPASPKSPTMKLRDDCKFLKERDKTISHQSSST